MMFDFNDVEDGQDFDVIPAGTYPAYVDKVDVKTSQNGDDYLNLMWRITGEQYENRTVFQMLHINNSNEKAKLIALQTVKKLLTACGFTQEKMSFGSQEQLIEALLTCRAGIKLKIKKDAEYGDKNEIKGFETMTDVPVNGAKASTDDIPF